MHCPFCQAEETRVIDSRTADSGLSIRRRRECTACGERFTTFEHADLRMPQVVKSDGRREPFNDDKLRGGMLRALEKRPVGADSLEAALNRIRQSLMTAGNREVSAQRIGELVMHELYELDQVAYVRFASVYRRFQDLDAFSEEVRRLQSQPSSRLRRQQLSLLPGGDEDKAD